MEGDVENPLSSNQGLQVLAPDRTGDPSRSKQGLGKGFFLYLVLGAAAMAGLVWWVGPSKVAALAVHSNPLWLAVAFLLYLAFLVARGIRWAWLLRPLGQVTYRNTVGITILGWFVNAFIPLRAGEFARAYLLNRRERIGVVEGISTVAVERVLDVITIATISFLSLLFVPHSAKLPPPVMTTLRVAWIIPAALVALIVAGLYFEEGIVRGIGRLFGFLPERAHARMENFMRGLIRGAKALRVRRSHVAALVALSFGLWLISIAMYLAFYEAMIPDGHPPLNILVPGFAVFLLTFTVTFLPGNVGTYEGFFVMIFSGLGLAVAGAGILGFAVMTHLFSMLFMGIIGSANIVWFGVSARQLVEGTEELREGYGQDAPSPPEAEDEL